MILFNYRISVSFDPPKRLMIKNKSYGYGWWFWMWHPYKKISGVIFRICGFYFNIREKNAEQKLISQLKPRNGRPDGI